MKEEARELLGTMPDAKVASILGITAQAVYTWRKREGISSWASQARPNEEIINLLGTMPDAEIASMFGIAQQSVFSLRKKRGVSKYRKKNIGIGLKADVLNLLGKIPDKELAEQLGVRRQAVYNWRLREGVPACKKPKKVREKPKKRPNRIEIAKNMPEVLELIGKVPDHEIAYKFGMLRSTIFKARKALGVPPCSKRGCRSKKLNTNPEILALLGTMPDTVLASRAGVTEASIFSMRKSRGIPPHRREKRNVFISPEIERLMGTMTDKKIAEITGLSRLSVYNHRKKLGIPRYLKTPKKEPAGNE